MKYINKNYLCVRNNIHPKLSSLKANNNMCFELERIAREAVKNNRPVRMYLDTCSLMMSNSYGLDLLNAIEKIFPKYGMRVYLFSSVLQEIAKVGRKDLNLNLISKKILEKIQILESSGIVEVVCGLNQTFTDINVISRLVYDLGEANVILITQDKALSNVIMKFPDVISECVDIRNSSRVIYIEEVNGDLCYYESSKNNLCIENDYIFGKSGLLSCYR